MAKKKKKLREIRIGERTLSHNTLSALQEYLNAKPSKRDDNMLYKIIYEMALDGEPWPYIAERVGLPWQECKRIFDEMMLNFHSYSPAEMRLMLTAQVQRIINYMQASAAQGSEKHAQVMLQGIERLAKMHELEVATTKIEIELVTNHQAELINRVISMILENILTRPEIRNAVNPEIIDVVVGDVLEIAGAEIRKAERTMIDAKTPLGGVLPAEG